VLAGKILIPINFKFMSEVEGPRPDDINFKAPSDNLDHGPEAEEVADLDIDMTGVDGEKKYRLPDGAEVNIKSRGSQFSVNIDTLVGKKVTMIGRKVVIQDRGASTEHQEDLASERSERDAARAARAAERIKRAAARLQETPIPIEKPKTHISTGAGPVDLRHEQAEPARPQPDKAEAQTPLKRSDLGHEQAELKPADDARKFEFVVESLEGEDRGPLSEQERGKLAEKVREFDAQLSEAMHLSPRESLKYMVRMAGKTRDVDWSSLENLINSNALARVAISLLDNDDGSVIGIFDQLIITEQEALIKYLGRSSKNTAVKEIVGILGAMLRKKRGG
jgi:hypothetical protein